MSVSIRVTTSGPFFQGDAGQRANRALENAVRRLVEMGEERLDEVLRPRPAGVYLSVAEAKPGKASTGHYRRSVHGEVKGTQGVIDDSGVIYGPWLEGTGSRNQTTRFKGYSSFRRTAQFLEKQAKDVLEKEGKRLAVEFNG